MSTVDHLPVGSPCALCGRGAHSHRVSHAYLGSGLRCERCALPRSRHRPARVGHKGGGHKPHHKKWLREDTRKYVGLDGEGQGRDVHRYVMLAAASEDGSYRDVTGEDLRGSDGGLSTRQCLDFILSIPEHTRIFAYGFNYDLTKILADLDNKSLYMLFRPELRPRPPEQRHIPVPTYVRWPESPPEDGSGSYLLNLQGTKFVVVGPDRTRRVVWDVVKFYQSRFVKALQDWKVGDPAPNQPCVACEGADVACPLCKGKRLVAELDNMQYMKEHRGEFDKFTRQQVLDYCYSECRKLGALVHKLVDAHSAAGLKLRTFYGAGSTGGLILKKMGIDKRVRDTHPLMRHAVERAFFGGRFEHRVIGPVEGPLWSYDISSAYPYQTRFLPCLDHGRWEKVTRRSDLHGVTTALVHYRLHDSGGDPTGWAPFPHRSDEGSICFPKESGGGWVYLDEFVAGEALFPGVEFVEAYAYRPACDCVPFREIPHFYLERLKLGKEGAGIVLKLGPNSVYGKLAQSVGVHPPFQCWLWAGMITSGCRAQILALMGLHRDVRNLLAIATDGVYTRERIVTPRPLDTGTFTKLDGSPNEKPLGGWEEKATKGDVFFARPGIYFENGAEEEHLARIIRARGMGRGELVKNATKIERAWARGDEVVELGKALDRFCGAKTSTWKTSERGPLAYKRSRDYGQWVKRPLALSLSPLPKRQEVLRDGKLGWLTLRSRRGSESAAYDRARAMTTPEALELRAAAQEAIEQPDSDLVIYDPVSPDGYWQ